jgi:hypothetical protein
MAENQYFRNLPNFLYTNRNKNEKTISNYIEVKNLFKRGKLREDIFSDLQFFEKYQIIGDERPDNVAQKFYNDPSLDWIILLANNILNVYDEWPLSQSTFDKVMLERYGSYDELYAGIHHYETIELTDSTGKVLIPEGRVMPKTWKTNGNFVEIINHSINAIFSGDGINTSTTVTVVLNDGISGLQVGNQVQVDNVSENIYNGRFTVTSVNSPFSDGVIQRFTYELDTVPDVVQPYLSDNRSETVSFIITDPTLTGNSYYYEYYDDNYGYYVTVSSSSFLNPVTNYEYEMRLENEKRGIYILKPIYLNVIFNDIDKVMPYKEGATQYVSSTMKRGDNIRLYD